ncbi:MAG: hypothetical protein HGA45_01985 [Chloroflexales bacterium]|nr:hypothetical protein [Chloroflexales bacterium]
MARRTHYTQDEWLLLGKAPVLIGMAMMGVGTSSPFQLARELIGMGQALRETGQTHGASALIRDLNVETQAQLSELSQRPTSADDYAQLRQQLPELCARAARIVDAKESPSSASQYKLWLLWIGRRVATAAHEEIGRPVNADEMALLKQIAAALGVRGSEDAPAPAAGAQQVTAAANVTREGESDSAAGDTPSPQ